MSTIEETKAKANVVCVECEVQPTRAETFIIDDGVEECRFCGWMCELPESHMICAMQNGCKYIEARYDLEVEMAREYG